MATRLAYDNLKPALARILAGGERALTIRFAALASHYLFEPSFCRPGVGNDKGGVEARGKYIRLQALTPIPAGDTLDAINAQLLAQLDARRDTRGMGSKPPSARASLKSNASCVRSMSRLSPRRLSR